MRRSGDSLTVRGQRDGQPVSVTHIVSVALEYDDAGDPRIIARCDEGAVWELMVA